MSSETHDSGTSGPAPGGDDGEAKPAAAEAGALSPIEALERKVQELEQLKREQHDRLLRSAADFENFKKRARKELDEAMAKGREDLAREILPVVDNLERALKHANAEDPLAKGVAMVERQMLTALEKSGVKRFDALGAPFDPALHEAIQQVETAELPPGTVAQEFQRGYMCGTRLLRPAMVAVSKAPPAPPEEGEADSADDKAPGAD